ncbi:uncharacterized protein LOC143840832 [Paroedura picta]|uniref:uncharacterized protein LOC143840832 n=1 Tax=Paroedura picta TaxID=143630 RepID=UPI004055EA18
MQRGPEGAAAHWEPHNHHPSWQQHLSVRRGRKRDLPPRDRLQLKLWRQGCVPWRPELLPWRLKWLKGEIEQQRQQREAEELKKKEDEDLFRRKVRGSVGRLSRRVREMEGAGQGSSGT